MELFKLFGTIAIDCAEAEKGIEKTSAEARGIGKSFTESQAVAGKSLSQIASENGKTVNQIRSEVAKAAAEYRKQGMNASDAMRKAYEDIGYSAKSTHEAINKEVDGTEKGYKTLGEKIGGALGKVGNAAVKVGKTVAVGMAAAGAAMAGLTIKAMNLSGELEQNMGGSEAVFAEYAGKMQDTAKTAFENMGLSVSDFLGTANKMGALFQGAGFSIEESADLAANAMQRAADVASIMGIDTSAAMEAIAGAAKGNFTMMDNLGVAMNDTAIEAYALSRGIEKSTTEMTQQEKIGLAMEMFLEKTAYATGNYAKENETLAGSLGTAKAALVNFLDGSGDVEGLASAFSNASKVIVDNLKTLAPRLVVGITDLLNHVVPLLPGLLQELLPAVVDGAVSLIEGLVSALPGLVDMLLNSALPQLLSAAVAIVKTLVTALPDLVKLICEALPTLTPMLVSSLVSLIVILCENFSQIIQPILDSLPAIVITTTEVLMENLPVLVAGIGALIVGVAQALPQLLNAVWVAIKGALASVASHLGEWLSPAWQAISEWFSNLWQGVVGVFENIKNSISTALQFIGSIFSAAFQIITLPFQFIWENCKEYVFAAFEWIKNAINSAISFIKNIVTTGFNFVKEKIITPITNAKDTVVEAFNVLRGKVATTVSNIKETVTNTFNRIKEAMQKPIEKARDVIKGIVEKIKGFFDFEFKIPGIKLPHFSISPAGWKVGDLLEGSIPKLSIEWYAKAMAKPLLMTKPTIFGFDPTSGSFMGGGEKGSEVVSGTNTLMGMISEAVERKTADHTDRIVSVLMALLEAVVGGNQEMVGVLTSGQTFKVGEREFARLVREYA